MVQMEFEQNDLKPGLGALFLLGREAFHVLMLWAEEEGLESQKTDWNLQTQLLMVSLLVIGAGATFEET